MSRRNDLVSYIGFICPFLFRLFFHRGNTPPRYPFLFRLEERSSPKWDNSPRPMSYWVEDRFWRNGIHHRQSRRVCLSLAHRYVCEIWLIAGTFAVLPTVLWVISNDKIIPLNPYLSIVIGLFPAFVWRVYYSRVSRKGLLINFWGNIPEVLRPWVERIIRTPERQSPISWASDSEDEVMLRYMLVYHFNALDEQQDAKIVFWRTFSSFFSPLVIVLVGIYFQLFLWSALGASKEAVPVFAVTCVLWLVFSYLYSEIQLMRLHEQVYVPSGKAAQKFPPVMEETFCGYRKDISRLSVRVGVPAILMGMTTLTISLLLLQW